MFNAVYSGISCTPITLEIVTKYFVTNLNEHKHTIRSRYLVY